jgi:hypothetical protein
MKKHGIVNLIGWLILSLAFSGCLSFGSGDETIQQTKTPTTGQELMDLKAAYDKGLISEREYNQQRATAEGKIMSGDGTSRPVDLAKA